MDSIFDLNNLRQNIIELCGKNDVSVNRILKECGLNRNIIDNLKIGCEPQLLKIAIIADYFNVTVDFLVNHSPVESEIEK